MHQLQFGTKKNTRGNCTKKKKKRERERDKSWCGHFPPLQPTHARSSAAATCVTTEAIGDTDDGTHEQRLVCNVWCACDALTCIPASPSACLKPFRFCVCDCAPECVAPEDNMRLPHLYDLRVHLMCHSAVRRLTSFIRRCDDTLDFVPRLRDAQISRSTIDTCVCACLCAS